MNIAYKGFVMSFLIIFLSSFLITLPIHAKDNDYASKDMSFNELVEKAKKMMSVSEEDVCTANLIMRLNRVKIG